MQYKGYKQGRRPYPPNAAFSLVELLVALTLFALFAAGLASLTIQSRKLSEAIIYEDQVNRSISNFLEEIRGIGHGRVWLVHQSPNTGFDLTIPDISGAGAIDTVTVPVAIVDDANLNSQWTTLDVEATTKDGDTSTIPVDVRIELNNHENYSSENTRGIEVIINYRWRYPWERGNDYQTSRAIAYVADETP